MTDLSNILPLITVGDVLESLRELVRLSRQREEWTQADLARRSGVPMTTISRLERTGLASTDTLFKVLFALNRLDVFEDVLKAQLRLVKFPKSLEGNFESASKVVQRIRHKEVSR
jgi:transcriptional regulator with XRE-family HTH domain